MLQGADLSLLLMMNTRREEVEDDSVVGKTTSRKWMMIMVKKRATGAVSCDWRRCECTTRKETHADLRRDELICLKCIIIKE